MFHARMFPVATIIALTLYCSLATADAPSAPNPDEIREGTLIFKIPQGWRRSDTAVPTNWIYLDPVNPQPGTTLQLRFCRAFDMEGKTLRKYVEDDLDTLAKQTAGHQRSELAEFKTPTGLPGFSALNYMRVQFLPQYWLTAHIQAGDRIHTAILVAESRELGQQHAPALDALIASFRFTNLITLAQGHRPLTRAMTDDVSDFFEWLLDVPLTTEQRSAMESALTHAWTQDNALAAGIIGQMETLRKQLDDLPTDQRTALRQAAAPLMAQKFRDSRGVTKMLADIYDAGHKPLATAGQSRLTRQAADANLEMIYFMANQVAGGSGLSPTQEQKDKWAADLAARFEKMTEQERQNLGMMPLTLAAAQANWPQATPEQREQLKTQWAAIDNVKQVVETINKAREQAQKVAAASGLSPDQSQYLKAMRDLQHQQMTTQMISNMMAMRHQTNMAIIRNMGSTNWKYEYRYTYRYR